MYKQIFWHYKNILTQRMLMLNSISSACIAGPACLLPLYVNTMISIVVGSNTGAKQNKSGFLFYTQLCGNMAQLENVCLTPGKSSP